MHLPSPSERRGRVWVLEDSPLEAEMARRALCASQEVSLFDDGSFLLEELARGGAPDVLVLDRQIPGLSGLEVCRIVREKRGPMALPVLMLTVQGDKEDIIEALEAGANDYVTKPYHISELVARVGNLVTLSRLAATQAARTRQLALGADVGAALTEGRGLTEIARRVAEVIASHLDGLAVEIWTHEGSGLVTRAAAHTRADVSLPCDTIAHVAESGEKVEDFVVGPRGIRLPFVAIPLLVRGEVLGVLGVCTREPLDDGAATLSTATNLLALGLSRARVESERLVLLERERNARAEAEAANRSKDEFLAMVSHELRTPLNAITGWTSMLLSGMLDPERTRHAYETIHRNARSQAQLLEDLLDIGRITSGNLRLVESTFEIGAVAEMALESVRPTAEARGLVIEARIDRDAGTMTGDAARIQQVIWNLLSNAIKFTPSGGTISLSVGRDPRGFVIEVRDTGQGIAPEALPMIFERFKQADNSPSRVRGGLGLGLSIVRHLVELHGGTITAKSDGLGKGATFTVVLPSTPLRRDCGSERVVRSRSDRVTCPHVLEGMRVLVVDDEADARDQLRTLLEGWRVNVATASNAAEALSVVTSSSLDVLLSDIAMPDGDGLSLIRSVRSLPRERGGNLPAVAVTAYARLEDRTRALQAGYDAHLAKPVEPVELLTLLSDLGKR